MSASFVSSLNRVKDQDHGGGERGGGGGGWANRTYPKILGVLPGLSLQGRSPVFYWGHPLCFPQEQSKVFSFANTFPFELIQSSLGHCRDSNSSSRRNRLGSHDSHGGTKE